MPTQDYNRDLKQVMKTFNYRGCLVTELKNGFEVLGVLCEDLKKVDQTINEAFYNLAKSIK